MNQVQRGPPPSWPISLCLSLMEGGGEEEKEEAAGANDPLQYDDARLLCLPSTGPPTMSPVGKGP